MKKTLFFILFLCGILKTYSQDTIYLKKEKTPIISKIIEINSSEIKYKKFNYQDGALFIIEKEDVEKINFKNGDTQVFTKKNARQEDKNLIANSKIYLQFSNTEKKKNVNKIDALNILRREINNLAACKIVNSMEDADFVIDMQAIKYMITKRKVKLKVIHLVSNENVFDSEWEKGAPSEFNGFSGTRQATGRVIKRQLLYAFPEIVK
ncbi:hypothetical protein KO494_14335 [Lacinutrix sp. C3R15]|uniref:hypothetical protein n=1 Tax=Flavobacteriaceae TaxID=49546 RepID=UPI001C0A2FEE|nr:MULTISPECIES: hypothetical protein [Flavobacteriaceae]MBU2940723.1 hypothetical protein [Lacinutrix sp. C3R15]MDO6624041.1 hypothetical protein [Oceanihabitans sp. 1_MG-2023]